MLLNREEEGIDIPDLDWIKWMAHVKKYGDIKNHIFIYILYKLEFSKEVLIFTTSRCTTLEGFNVYTLSLLRNVWIGCNKSLIRQRI